MLSLFACQDLFSGLLSFSTVRSRRQGFAGIGFHPVHKDDIEFETGADFLFKKIADVFCVLVVIRDDRFSGETFCFPVEPGCDRWFPGSWVDLPGAQKDLDSISYFDFAAL